MPIHKRQSASVTQILQKCGKRKLLNEVETLFLAYLVVSLCVFSLSFSFVLPFFYILFKIGFQQTQRHHFRKEQRI